MLYLKSSVNITSTDDLIVTYTLGNDCSRRQLVWRSTLGAVILTCYPFKNPLQYSTPFYCQSPCLESLPIDGCSENAECRVFFIFLIFFYFSLKWTANWKSWVEYIILTEWNICDITAHFRRRESFNNYYVS